MTTTAKIEALEQRLAGLEDVVIQILAAMTTQLEAHQKLAARMTANSKSTTDRDSKLENGD